jgi:TetR/AcrR family transcriptional regulator, repressor for neighboring sulfatase
MTTSPAAAARPTGRDEITDAVLDAAERLFAAAGPADVSLRTIAQEADVTYGLVYRHFGTKDVLLERLLMRYTERWKQHLGTSPDYASALQDLLGESFDTGPYLRLLAWTLLTGVPDRDAESYRRHATLDELPGLAPGADTADERAARLQTAGALAFAFGWRFFNPFIRAALHFDHDDPAAVQRAIQDQLRALST